MTLAMTLGPIDQEFAINVDADVFVGLYDIARGGKVVGVELNVFNGLAQVPPVRPVVGGFCGAGSSSDDRSGSQKTSTGRDGQAARQVDLQRLSTLGVGDAGLVLTSIGLSSGHSAEANIIRTSVTT